jgi:glycolate oxidase iron-sulfur subunit
VTEFLAGIELPARRPVLGIATYHDPCHLSRYQKLVKQPRALLAQVPGLEFRELPEADWCCGGAGSYTLLHHDKSMQILARKMENVRTTGASILVTACPSCLMQLRYGATRFGVPVEVLHVSQVLQRSLRAAT